MKKILTLILTTLLFTAYAKQQTIAILGAFPQEIKAVSKLINGKEQRILGIPFYKGQYKNKKVILAATGIGTNNAAITTALLIDNFHPNKVILSGIAGGFADYLKTGDIVIGNTISQYNIGRVSKDGFEHFPFYNPANGKEFPNSFTCNKNLIDTTNKIAKKLNLQFPTANGKTRDVKFYNGLIVTGDLFINSTKTKERILSNFPKAIAVEMEANAIAQVCYITNTPFIAIQCISDGANEESNISYDKFEKVASNNAGKLTIALLDSI